MGSWGPLLVGIGAVLAPMGSVISAWLFTRRRSSTERVEAAQRAAQTLIAPDAQLVQAVAEEMARRQREKEEDVSDD